MNMASLVEASKGFGGVWQFIFSVLGVVIASSIVIEISPIKINPVKTAVGWISKSFKGWFEDVIDSSLDKQLAGIKEEDKKRDEAIIALDGAIGKMDQSIEKVTSKIDSIVQRMDDNEERAQKNHISLVRNNILSFSNNLRDGMDASKESFDNILDQIDEYNTWHDMTEERRKSNGKAIMSIKFVQDEYERRFNHVQNKSDES